MSLVLLECHILGNLDVLEGLESVLVKKLLCSIGQGLDYADMLAHLRESAQTFAELVHGNAVIDLIKELLDFV